MNFLDFLKTTRSPHCVLTVDDSCDCGVLTETIENRRHDLIVRAFTERMAVFVLSVE